MKALLVKAKTQTDFLFVSNLLKKLDIKIEISEIDASEDLVSTKEEFLSDIKKSLKEIKDGKAKPLKVLFDGK